MSMHKEGGNPEAQGAHSQRRPDEAALSSRLSSPTGHGCSFCSLFFCAFGGDFAV